MARSSARSWFGRAFAEAVLVVFAVLVALAVDEWWEEHENVELARRTLDAVAGEIRSNREELLSGPGLEDAAATMAELESAVAAVRQDREPESLAVNWDYTLLSSAAWETAQLTRSTQFMELDRVIGLAEVYELQRFYSRNQDELSSLIADFGGGMETEPVAALTRLQSRLATTLGLRTTLATIYACTLVELEGEGAVEEAACPKGG